MSAEQQRNSSAEQLKVLREQVDKLVEADRRKNEFVAALAHDVRNPLAAIVNGFQVLRQAGTKGPLAEQTLDLIGRQLKHVTRLIEDLVDLGLIGCGEVALRMEPVDMASVAADVVELCRPSLVARGHEFTVSVPATPLLVEGDPARLQQIISSLLANAARHAEPGGQVILTVERDGDEAVVRVQEVGIGIAPEIVSRVLALFSRAGELPDASLGSLGLSLALVKRLVELHHGQATVSSESAGQGFLFLLRFPLLSGEGAAPQPVHPAAAARHGPPLRLLVVEDDPDVAKSVTRLLLLWGHDVRAAYDGPQALRVAREHRPQIVLLDLGLPTLDGNEVARLLRQEAGLETACLVAMTGFGQEEDRRSTREAGFDHHLVKPVAPDALQALLASLEADH